MVALQPQQERRDDGHAGQRQQQRPEERRADRDGHGAEHLPLEPLEREDRQVDRDDDEHAEQHGACHFDGRAAEQGEAGLRGMLAGGVRQPIADVRPAPDKVLHHHDGAIDQQTEIDRTERHEVGRDAEQAHADEADEHRQWDDGRDDEGGPHVAQEEEQHDDDEEAAFDEVPRQRGGGAIDDVTLVIELLEAHALRQRVGNLGHARADAVGHLEGVFALQHDDHAGHDLALSVARHRAVARHRRHGDGGDVAEQDGAACGRLQHDALEIGQPGQQAHAAHRVAFGLVFDEPAAERLVAVGDGLQHVAERQLVLLEPGRIDDDVELLGEAAPRVDFADPDDRAQAVADVPVVRGLGDHGVEALAGHDVLVDFAEGGGHRAEDGLQPLGNARAHVGEPLGHQLARKVGGHIVAENHRHDREAELRDRPHFLGARHTHEGRFDGIRHALLDLGRRKARGLGDHDDLVVREVGKGLDRQITEGEDAGHDQRNQRHEDECPLPEGRVDEALDEAHAIPPRRRRVRPGRT